MRLTVGRALTLALLAALLPGCERTATDQEEAASKGQTAASNDRSAPARPASK
jgi:hypothetical protein